MARSEPNKTEQSDLVKSAGRVDIFASIYKWVPAAILILTALIYSRVFFNDFTSIDDDTFILNNPLIKAPGLEGILSIFTTINYGKYQPFILLTYLLEYRKFGFNPIVFHLFNVFLHLLNTWLVFKCAEKLSGKAITAMVVSVLFAIHPMHVEEVAWASELKDTLPAFFYLFAMLLYLRYIDSGFKVKYYIGLLLFFVGALFSKSASVTLPVILLLIDVYKGRSLDKRAWLEKLPLVIFSLFFLFLGTLSKSAGAAAIDTMPVIFSFISRVFLSTYVPSFYIVKLIAPFGLSVMHYYPQLEDGFFPWIYYASLPFLLLVAWLVFRPSPFRKELIFGVLFFIITISVMEQIVSIGPSLTPERYTYIPYFGFFYIIGQWLSNLWEGKSRNIAIGIFAAALTLFCALTWARIAVWKNDDTVFSDIVTKNAGSPDCYYPYFVLGKIKHGHGNLDEALRDYNESIALNPMYAGTYNNRGGLFFQINDMESALVDFNHAIALDPRKAGAYNNRATLEASTGDFKAAYVDYSTCLKIDPGNRRAYSDRGMVRLNLKDSTGACSDWKTALYLGAQGAAELLRQYCH